MEKEIITTVYLPAQTAQMMKHYCVDNNVKMKAFIVQAIQEKLAYEREAGK